MVNAPVSLRRFALALITLAVAAAWPAGALAQGADRDLYAAARALEQTARLSLDDQGAQAERSLDDVHTAVAAYLLVPKRFPASSYSDDALWKAGQLSLDAFARFGRTGDRDAGQRLLKRLATGYPGSKLAKQVPVALAGAAPAVAAPAPAAAAVVPPPAAEPPPAPAPVATAPGPTPAASAAPAAAPAASRAKPAAVRATGSTATIRSIRRTVLPDAVRIIIELDGEVVFQQERITGPDRVFLDLRRRAPPRRSRTRRSASTAILTLSARCASAATRTARRASCSMPAASARTACTHSTTRTGS